MPAHHLLEQYLDEYVAAAGIEAEKTAPLSRTLGGRGRKQLTKAPMSRQDARRMIVQRAIAAGIVTHGGLLNYAQQMAAHESTRTTKLYDRRNDQVTLDQVERIVL